MLEISFLVQGSAVEPYKVSIRRAHNNLSAYCSCPAGQNGQYCKHRVNILNGLKDGVVSENINDIDVVNNWLHGTDIEIALNNMNDAEEQFEIAKRNLSVAKKRLSKAFHD